MTRITEDSDRDFSAGSGARKSSERVDRVELLEAFDDAIRARFGRFISAAALKPAKRRRTARHAAD